MADPSFLVIGAQKCGTSWLYQMMRQHPEVFVTTPKGLYYFDNPDHYARGAAWYRGHFDGSERFQARGEVTPNYFWTSDDAPKVDGRTIPQRVAELLPDVKLILMLRDPVERAVSAYFHHIRQRRLNPRQRLLDVADLHGIASMGYYDQHLERWLEVFDREQLLVMIYEEDVAGDGRAGLERACRFLGVDEGFSARFVSYRYNSRRSHLHMRLNFHAPRLARVADRVLPGVVKNHPRLRIPVGDHERAELARRYAPHNARLAELLGRPLPWRTP